MAEYLRIIPASNSTPGRAPKPEELQTGELALNTADGVLYTKNADGAIIPCGVGPTTGDPATSQDGCCGDYGIYSGERGPAIISALYAACVSSGTLVRWVQEELAGECGGGNATLFYNIELKDSTSTEWQHVAYADEGSDTALLPPVEAGSQIRVKASGWSGMSRTSEAVTVQDCGSWACNGSTCIASSASANGLTVFSSRALCTASCSVVDPLPLCNSSVSVSSGWTATTCTVSVGQTVTFTASGTVTFKAAADSDGGNTANPDGIVGYPLNPSIPGFEYGSCSVNAAWRHMALIGRIGSTGTPFLIGSSKTITATSAGVIQLRANDTCSSDNSGSYAVQLEYGNQAP